MSVKFPDNDDDFNNEFDAAVKGGYKHIFARSIFEPYLFNAQYILTQNSMIYKCSNRRTFRPYPSKRERSKHYDDGNFSRIRLLLFTFTHTSRRK